jgi:phage terminase Nu1 subunit (DNA packaging protein)
MTIFGVSRMTITDWCRAGMPKLGYGSYDVAACVQWRVAQIQQRAHTTAEVLDGRAELIRAQTERYQLENARLRGTLIDAAYVRATVQSMCATIATMLDALAPRATPELLQCTDAGAIQELLFRECRAVRDLIADQVRSIGVALDRDERGGDRAPTTRAKRERMGGRVSDPAPRITGAGTVAHESRAVRARDP